MTRQVFPLSRHWLYSSAPVPGCTQPDFDDSSFEQVTIPHTNRVLPWHSFDDKEYQFVSIYRRHITLPPDLQGQRLFVDFGGVMTAATVTINGERLGEYCGGFTPFSFELTGWMRWGQANVLAVEVDSTECADIPPAGIGSITSRSEGSTGMWHCAPCATPSSPVSSPSRPTSSAKSGV